jgi:hypothetical protein
MGIIVKIGTKGQVMKFIKSLLYGLQYINDTFYSYIQSKKEELKYNSQLINLKKRLNDLFDNSLRQIYIVNVSSMNLTWIFRYSENSAVYISRYTESAPVYIKRYTENFASDDFIIYVPASLVYNQALFNSIVNRYVLADKRYTIQTYIP